MKFKTLKNFTIVFIIALTASGISSQTLFVDDFLYGPLSNLNGTNGWVQSGVTLTNKVTVVSPGLTYSGYQGSGFGNTVFFSNITEGEIVMHDFTPVSSGSVYYACMINVNSLTDSATQGYNITFDPSGGTTAHTASLFIKRVTATLFNFGLRKAAGVPVFSNNAHIIATTCIAVVKYTFAPGAASDTCKLYIFTSGVPATEPVTPEVITSAGSDAADIGQIGLSNSYAQNGLKGSAVKIDGIRIGTSWLGTTVTASENEGSIIPSGFKLEQNYPNPFNPVTGIKYSVSETGMVSLRVYDITGNEVSVLVNGIKSAGTYSVSFDASNLSSGIYFCRMNAGKFSSVKKMTLVK